MNTRHHDSFDSHDHRHDQDGSEDGLHEHVREGWPDRTDVLSAYDASAAYAGFLADVTPNVMQVQLRRMGRPAASRVLQMVHLSPGSRMNTGVASAILAKCRRNPEIISYLGFPLGHAMNNAHEATIESWTAFFDHDPYAICRVGEDGRALTVSESLGAAQRMIVDEIFPVCLANEILGGAEPAAALLLLATLDEAAAVAAEELRKEFPLLPAADGTIESFTDGMPWVFRTLVHLRTVFVDTQGRTPDPADAEDIAWFVTTAHEFLASTPGAADPDDETIRSLVARALEVTGDVPRTRTPLLDTPAAAAGDPNVAEDPIVVGDEATGSATATVPTPAATPTSAPTQVSGVGTAWPLDDADDLDLEGLASLVRDLPWAAAVATAERVLSVLEDEVSPSAEDLRYLQGFCEQVARVAAAVSAAHGTIVEPAGLDLSEAISELRASAAADSLNDVYRELASASVPPSAMPAMPEVAALCAQAIAGTAPAEIARGLRALHALATLTQARRRGEEVDFALYTECDSTARAALPPTTHIVVAAASFGEVTPGGALTSEDPVRPTPAAPAAEKTAPDPTAEDDPEPTTTPAEADDAPVESELPTAAQSPAEGESDPADTTDTTGDPSSQPAATEPATEPDAEPVAEAVAAAAEPPEGVAASDLPVAPAEAPTDVPSGGLPAAAASEPSQEDLMAQLRAQVLGGDLQVKSLVTKPAPLPPAVVTEAVTTAGTGPTARTDAGDAAVAVGSEDLEEDEPSEDPYRETRRHEATLLSARRYGLASLLHAEPAHAAARRLAAFQSSLTAPAGGLATAFATDAATITRDALADDRPGQILAWASAVRVSIVAPAAGAAALLSELGPCLDSQPALTSVAAAYTRAAALGAVAMPDAARELSAVDEADTSAKDAANQAAALVSGANSRTFKYTPANGVYQNWMDPETGVLGQLLSIVATNDHEATGKVLAAVTGLRGTGEKRLDETFAARRNSNRRVKMVGGARTSLLGVFSDALDLATEWAQNSAAAEDRRSQWGPEQHAARPLDTLRNDLETLRSPALEELLGLRVTLDDPAEDPAAAVLNAAVDAANTMLSEAFGLVGGRVPTGPEPSAAFLVSGALTDTDLPLDPDTLLPPDDTVSPAPGDAPGAGRQFAGPTGLTDAVVDLAERGVDYERAYTTRSGLGEHDLTAVLVRNIAALDPDLGRELSTRRDTDVAESRERTRLDLERAEGLIRVSLRDATLPDDEAASLQVEVNAARDPNRSDFRRIHTMIGRVESTVETHRAHQQAQARGRIEAASLTNAAVATHREALSELVDKGQVAGALEFLEQLVATGKLPAPRDEGKHFARFFPAVPRLAQRVNLQAAIRVAFADPETPTSPTPATTPGKGKPQPPTAEQRTAALEAVAELARIAEVDLDSIGEQARRTAAKAVRTYTALMNPRDQNADTLLAPVLALAGYEFTGAKPGPKEPGRRWVQLSGVTGVGQALSPALGSAMSRGGTSLRVLIVSKATPPTTVVDWLRNERAEETILVLHATSYTEEERRALANASRGRPQPVIAVLDPAALAYLAMQPEHSRTTFAAITLPFTGDSPYRDRAGRAAPEMFYGRTKERADVMALEGPSFVSGGRQLGKSALLWSAKESFEGAASTEHRSVFLEIRTIGAAGDPDQLWPRLHSALVDADVLAPRHDTTSGAGTQRAADGPLVAAELKSWVEAAPEQRRLLVLLDETDQFLDADAVSNRFENIGLCKQIMDSTGRRVKFVFAGLHRTARFEALPNQPLAHLGRPIIVGPLGAQAAFDLLTRPLTALGYRFVDPQLQPARILAFTNNVPSLLQLFGQSLIAHMTSRELTDGPPSTITDDDITAVLEDTDLQEAFRDKYLLTLQLDRRYTVIVYAIAYAALGEDAGRGVTLPELEALCAEHWPTGFADVTREHLRGLVAECVDLGVLAHDAGRYRMRTETMLRLLGTLEQIEETLIEAEQLFELPSASDIDSHRATQTGSANRFPLTTRQIAQILSARNECVVVAGSSALGIRWVPACLEQLGHDGAARQRKIGRIPTLTAPGVRSRIQRATGPTLLVADASGISAAALAELIETAETELANAAADQQPGAADVVVIITADETSAPTWAARGDGVVELAPVNAAGLRSWCDEVSAAFGTTADQDPLLTATGGWPKVITAALGTDQSGVGAADRVLDAVHTHLAGHGGKTLAAESGLLARPDLNVNRNHPAGAEATAIAAVLHDAFLATVDVIGTDADAAAPVEELAAVVGDMASPTTAGTGKTGSGSSGSSGTAGATVRSAAAVAGFASVEDVLEALRTLGALRTGTAGSQVWPDPVLHQALIGGDQ